MAAGGGRGIGESEGFLRDLWRDEGGGGGKRGHGRSVSAVTVSTQATDEGEGERVSGRRVWEGEGSVVIGLQKRGLRGLMEGRRLRERGVGSGVGVGVGAGSVGS